MDLRKPQNLEAGDVVGIVSPSEPITSDLKAQFDRAVSTLETFGLKVKTSPHAFDQHYYNAGTAEHRISDFNSMWADPEVKMILMSQGGKTANHLLDGLDYEMMRSTPKIFAGISDGTTLLNAIYARSGIITYHGPDLLWSFGRKITAPFRENFIQTFFNGTVGKLSANKNWKHLAGKQISYSGWRTIRKGTAEGKLVGGHIGCLCSTMLAGYGPNFDDTILFLEGTDDVASLDRWFTSLRHYGVFERINGLVLGWFENHELSDSSKTRAVADMVLEVTKRYSFPILEIGELGHNVENYIFPLGIRAQMDAEGPFLGFVELSVA